MTPKIEDEFIDWFFLNHSLMEELESEGYKWIYFAKNAPALDIDHVLITDEFPHGDLVVTKKFLHVLRGRDMGLDIIGRKTMIAATTHWILEYFKDLDTPIEITHKDRDGWVAVVHPCARPSCKWQGSMFDDRGPVGHIESQSQAGAVERLVEDGYTKIEVGALKRVLPAVANPAGSSISISRAVAGVIEDGQISGSGLFLEGFGEIEYRNRGAIVELLDPDKAAFALVYYAELEGTTGSQATAMIKLAKKIEDQIGKPGLHTDSYERGLGKYTRNPAKKLSTEQLDALTLAAAKTLHRGKPGRITGGGTPGKYETAANTLRALSKKGYLEYIGAGSGHGPSGTRGMSYTYEITEAGLAMTDPDEVRRELDRRLAKQNPPFSGYDARYTSRKPPKDPTKISYRRKRDALNVFLDHNGGIIDEAFSGPTAKQPKDSFDNFNHQFGLKGKRQIDNFAKALWLAMPPGVPYYLEDIKVEMLNETSPMVHNTDRYLTIPDYAEEERLLAQEQEYWESKYGGVFPEHVSDDSETPF